MAKILKELKVITEQQAMTEQRLQTQERRLDEMHYRISGNRSGERGEHAAAGGRTGDNPSAPPLMEEPPRPMNQQHPSPPLSE